MVFATIYIMLVVVYLMFAFTYIVFAFIYFMFLFPAKLIINSVLSRFHVLIISKMSYTENR